MAKKHRYKIVKVPIILNIVTPEEIVDNIGVKPPIVFVLLNIRHSFFDTHADLVKHDLLIFKNEVSYENIGFISIVDVQDYLIIARERDRILLLRNQSPSMSSAGAGFAIFGIMTVTSAHAPKFMRFLFDGKIHVGPAMFSDGGMGVGIGSNF